LFKPYLILSCLIFIAACGPKPAENSAVQQRLTERNVSPIMVKLDIKVGLEGKVLDAKLASAQADTLFAKAALMKVKQQVFEVRYENGQAIEYWLYDMPIQAGQVTPLKPDTNHSQ